MKRSLFYVSIIVAVGLIAYSNTLNAPFVFDDESSITDNPVIKDLRNFTGSLEGYRFNPRRFIGYLTFAVNYHIGGLSVTGYHVFNIAVHIVNALLVYFLVLLTFRTPYFSNPPVPPLSGGGEGGIVTRHASRVTALVVALLFVAHPVQTGAVTYIVQRLTSLATMFSLLSLVIYVKWRLMRSEESGVRRQESEQEIRDNPPIPPLCKGGRPTPQGGESAPQTLPPLKLRGGEEGLPSSPSARYSYAWYFLSLLSLVLAMKSKEIAFTVPILILLYEWLFFKEKIKAGYLIPLLLTLLIIPASMLDAGKPLGEVLSDVGAVTRVKSELSRGTYFMTQLAVITTYVRLLFLPVSQNLDYDYPVYRSFLEPNVFLSFLFLALLFGTAVYLLYKSRVAKPVINKDTLSSLPDLIGQSREGLDSPVKPENDKQETIYRHANGLTSPLNYSRVTRHVLRLSAFGIFWFFITLSVESGIIPIVDVIFEHRIYLPSVGFFIAIASGAFAAGNLLEARIPRIRTVLVAVMVSGALVFAGATYLRNEMWGDAIRLWSDVVKKSPGKARGYYNLGLSYDREGKLEEAMSHYLTAIRLEPYLAKAHNNLGNIYGKQGRFPEAIREFQTVLAFDPADAAAHSNLGVAYAKQGQFAEALQEFRTALGLNPDFAEAYKNLGIAYMDMNRMDEAAGYLQAALKINPDAADAHNNLGIIYAWRGSYAEALEHFKAAVRIDPGDQTYRTNLNRAREKSR